MNSYLHAIYYKTLIYEIEKEKILNNLRKNNLKQSNSISTSETTSSETNQLQVRNCSQYSTPIPFTSYNATLKHNNNNNNLLNIDSNMLELTIDESTETASELTSKINDNFNANNSLLMVREYPLLSNVNYIKNYVNSLEIIDETLKFVNDEII
jgi:hypothetical protein